MSSSKPLNLLQHLLSLGKEPEWLEFKHNNSDPISIGEYISALANSAALHQQPYGYLVWGVEDSTKDIVGTSFQPHKERKGNQSLELWLQVLLQPRPDFRFLELDVNGFHVVLLEIPAARVSPIRFQNDEWIRVGENKKKLKEFPEKERQLWEQFKSTSFETDVALSNLSADAVLGLLEYQDLFRLLNIPFPSDRAGLMNRLQVEGLVIQQAGTFSITDMGAVLFARDLNAFPRLSRKALRIVFYKGRNKIQTIRERGGLARGYASDFEDAVQFIKQQLPSNEQLGQAFQLAVGMYPDVAIRELLANALIHQDFHISGAGPMFEVYEDRIEITNPGTPLIEPNRFLDLPPRSRNEHIAALMRRMNFCEERGSGIDKVVFQIEFYQLPPPDFRVSGENTVAILFAPRELSKMTREEKIRACYQHASLLWVSNQRMTNTSVRQRFKIEEHNYPIASKIIKDTLDQGLIKPTNPDGKSKKDASYIPFWA
jgi:ATP-dependent DNA helicase RecG